MDARIMLLNKARGIKPKRNTVKVFLSDGEGRVLWREELAEANEAASQDVEVVCMYGDKERYKEDIQKLETWK